MREFTAVDLSPQCEVVSRAKYEYELLERIPQAAELIVVLATQVWRNPDEFETRLDPSLELVLRWRASSNTAGIATVRDSEHTLSLSLLVGGIDVDGDTITLEAFQRYAVRELHDTGYEPSFDLIGLKERPLLATVGMFMPKGEASRRLFALADRCFAAAYFRTLGLV
jgi:hypothetical protein